ncbi:MAG: radical SAM protein [Firmicutes bacterium]|nr:radical SAM protein [Bacillota bacterium]
MIIEKVMEHLKYLFWRIQIGLLCACPPLCGIVSRSSLGAANSSKLWLKTLLRLAVQTPCALFQHWRNIRKKHVALSRVSILVTTCCTLQCDNCAAHIPDLKNHRDFPSSSLIRDVHALFACVDHVYATILSGGEAFLHPDLDEIVRACADSGKAGDISIQTNGTILPDAKTLVALREANVTVKISHYAPSLQPDVEKLKHLLEENRIHYTHDSATFWRDTGKFGELQKGSEKRRFSVCAMQLCMVYLYGKLHLCGESAFLLEEGLIPDCKEDYIDIRAITSSEFSGQWRKLLKKRSVTACSYCLGNTYKTPKIPVAVQRG